MGIPDVSVFRASDEDARPTAITSVLSQPISVNVPMVEEVHKSYLEIRQIGTGVVITVIEVLSPKNKRSGEGRDQYNLKRQKVLNGLSHFVEIDLLRAGEPQPISACVQSDYRILVSRSDRHPPANLYPFSLQDSIPIFPLPLQVGDLEPTINLNEIVEQVYQKAALA